MVSHESALVVHDLSDAMPARIHLTVPRGFQKKAPKGVILHHKELPGTETEERIGYRVTTPRQTLCDVADGALGEELLQQALKEALKRGLVRLKQINLNNMTAQGKMRMLMAIKALQE